MSAVKKSFLWSFYCLFVSTSCYFVFSNMYLITFSNIFRTDFEQTICLFVWCTVHLSGKRVDQMKSMNAVVNNVWAYIFDLVVFGMRVILAFAWICGIPNGFDWLLDVHLISVCYHPTNNLCNLYYDEFPYFMHAVYTFSSVAQTTKTFFFLLPQYEPLNRTI